MKCGQDEETDHARLPKRSNNISQQEEEEDGARQCVKMEYAEACNSREAKKKKSTKIEYSNGSKHTSLC